MRIQPLVSFVRIRGLASRRGFTMFFAVLVASLTLAIGIAIYDLVVRELQVSSITEQSQYAVYAAETGVECALYWDSRYNCQLLGGKTVCTSVFASSTTDLATTLTSVTHGPPLCDGVDVLSNKNRTTAILDAVSGMSTTTLTIPTTVAGRPYNYYVIFNVLKTVDALTGLTDTTVYSHGYNTTATTSASAVERELQSEDFTP